MKVAELKAALIERAQFSTATIEYWCEWFECRDQIPPTAEEAAAWIDSVEQHLGDMIPDMIPDSWNEHEEI